MKLKYQLNQDKLPTLPTPHDAVITKTEILDDYLILTFERNINRHDSIKYTHPNADSLIIKYHILDSQIDIYEYGKTFMNEGYLLKNTKKTIEKWNKNYGCELTYLYQYVNYNSLILHLQKSQSIYIELYVDYIEYEWL